MKTAASASTDGQDFVRRMHAVADARLRKHAVARELRRLGPGEAAQLLGAVIRLGCSRDEAASCVLSAVMGVLEEPELGRPVREALSAVPPEDLAEEVATLLASGPPRRILDVDAAAHADARNFSETLGLLKTRARTVRDPDAIARIALASEPSVVRNLLVNPRLVEATVVRLAARRPARAEPLVEVWRSRWGQRRPVRRALVFNPYLPPEVGVKLVPLLLRPDWEEIVQDPGLHPSVRAEAQVLLASPPGDLPRSANPEPIDLDAED